MVWNRKGEYDKALEFLNQSLNIWLKTLGNHHPNVATSYNNIGLAWNSKGKYEKAVEFFLKCLDIELSNYGEMHQNVMETYNKIGFLWRKIGDNNNALEYYQKILTMAIKTLDKQDSQLATSYFNVGLCQKDIGNFNGAIQSFNSAFNIQQKGGVAYQIATCHESLSENLKALAYYIKSAEIRKEDPDLAPQTNAIQQSIKACIRLAKELGKEGELPEWIKEKNSIIVKQTLL